jgi:SAM-dependent methyltransferase
MELLQHHRQIWTSKPVLRAIYGNYYQRIAGSVVPGLTLEIGGGTGNLKEYLDDVISTDIQYSQWLDAVADGQRLPFHDASFDNIVMFDVLHHLERPWLFLQEAARVLRADGRLICVEPAITPVSWLFYSLLHPEPIDMKAIPLAPEQPTPGRDPWCANQGIPTLLFGRDRKQLERDFPLRVISCQHLGLFAYPLSGGFNKWSLIPASLVRPLLKLEDWLLPLLGPAMGFRLMGVLERLHSDAAGGELH